ncbi:hypothetical protein MASR2M50_05220 [Thauera sp.]
MNLHIRPEADDSAASVATDGRASTTADALLAALADGRNKRVRKLLQRMHPGKIAALLESLSAEHRRTLWQQIDGTLEARVLAHLSAELRPSLAHEAGEDHVADAATPDAGAAARPGSTASELEAVLDALARGKLKRVGKLLQRMHPAKVAGLLEALPPRSAARPGAWSTPSAPAACSPSCTTRSPARSRTSSTPTTSTRRCARSSSTTSSTSSRPCPPSSAAASCRPPPAPAAAQQLESMLAYPEDSAGGLMNADAIAVRADVKAGTVLRYLRLLDTLPPQTDTLMVVDRKGLYRGALRLSVLVTADLDTRVSAMMQADLAGIPVDTAALEVARQFQDLDLMSAPVVDTEGRLIGRITVDDVVDLIREDSDRAVMQMAGLDDEADMFAPVLVSSRRRAVWLGINLLTAFLAAWVIGRFQGTLEQIVALAVLMPIVASMGGIAGSQTLTLVIRGLALKQVQKGNVRVLLNREVGIAALNGILWALVVAVLAVAWFGDWGIGGVIAAAILLNLLCAALAGLAIPLILERMGIDPALAGSVILTTVTDVVGFFAFLGLATVLLL